MDLESEKVFETEDGTRPGGNVVSGKGDGTSVAVGVGFGKRKRSGDSGKITIEWKTPGKNAITKMVRKNRVEVKDVG